MQILRLEVLVTFTEMLSSAFARIVGFLPNLLAALLILVVGLLIASLLARGTRRLLTGLDLDNRHGMRKVIDSRRSLARLPWFAGRIVYWVIALVTIGLAIDALQLTWLSVGVARVLGYLPSVLAAGAILLGAYLLANFLYRKLTPPEAEAGADEPSRRFWPGVLRVGIYVIAGFMALQELGIATTIVTSAFIIGLAAVAVAGAIAFGFGNRELAGQIMHEWYERRVARRPARDGKELPPEEPPILEHH
jgi:small-conductance mechanosensitive channel